MKSLFRRLSTVIVALCLSVTILSGCTSTPASSPDASVNTTPPSAATASAAGDPSAAPADGAPLLSEPITLKVLSETRADISLGNDMPLFKRMEERTNVHLEWELLPVDAADRDTKFNVVMASGDLPDLVQSGVAHTVNRYGMQGMFLPLQDLIAEHAPNIKAAFDNPLPNDEIPYKINVWSEITASDGNIYTIPLLGASNAIGAVWTIRADWLEKVGLPVPTTTDEFLTVLRAFKEQDPNGNGQADEIPLGSSQGGKTERILGLVNAFDAHMDLYVDPVTDTIKYGPVEENYKEGLRFLNQLYTEGLLEEDYLTATRDQWLARAGGNQQGVMYAWPGSGLGVANTELQKLDESFRFEVFKPLKSPSGKQFKDTKTAGAAVMYRTSVSANTKYPVEIMKYLDFCFSEEGTLLCNFGIEGTDYSLVNGEPKYTDYVLANPEGLDPETVRLRTGIKWQLLPYASGWDAEYQAMEKTAPWTVEAWDTYKGAGLVEAPFPTLGLTEDQLSERASLLAEIDTYKNPVIDKFIMGTESIDQGFDSFVENIEKSGLQDLLDMLNAAYDVYKVNSK